MENFTPIQNENQFTNYNLDNSYISKKLEIKFFDNTYLKKSNSFQLVKDPLSSCILILRKNISVLDSNTFETIKEVSLSNFAFNVLNPEDITIFSVGKTKYMLLFNENKICLFNLNIQSFSNSIIFELHQIGKDEKIINIKTLKNEVKYI